MTDQTDDALTDLINKLIDATHEKKIGWAETDEKDTYLYAARNSSILVAGRDTSEGRLRVTLRILNHEGTTVESLSSTWTASLLPGIGGATRGHGTTC
ncbi:hypothetical protein [Micromonospora aurantiaca (nom. illeg.)]|uniref:hypothetical protein n=1 Tax=Micromonospora aurantiaca (nom. illeg.) TaxID=47850 RepID=UPI000828088B|nr:hypothetical protein [Micromonospora aurantiaca]SCL42138.1 hypothetical protein GA0070615_5316 [Micromonospora aurantiaca]